MAEIVNPYIAGAPVTEKRMFFGREDIFQWIENNIAGRYADHILVIHGQRRVGKTSVLKQLGNRLPERYIPVFFDLQGRTHTTLDRFLWWLAREIVRVLKQDRGIDLPLPDKDDFSKDAEHFESRFLPDLEPALGGGTLLLTFDEFDNLEERGVKEELARPLVDYLRRLMGRAGLNFIFSIGSSGRKLENMQAEYTEFFKAALYKKISFLSEEQTSHLITRPVKGLLEYDRAAVDRIYELASGHPYFTQLTCHELFALCQRTGQRRISCGDVEAVLDDVVERGTVNLKFVWDEASDIEKWSLSALAYMEKADSHALADSLRREHVRFGETDLTSGLLHLREKDVLTPDNRFIVQLLRLWLQKNRPIEQVREELTEVNPIANRYIEIGLEFKDAAQYEKAIGSFQEALAIDRDNIRAQLNIALSYMEQDLPDKAVLEFEKALSMDDEDVSARAGLCEAHLALGDAAMSKGRSKDAVLSYQRVLTINAGHTDALQRLTEIHSQRADIARQAGQAKEELDALCEALKFSPEEQGLIARMAEVQAEMREHEMAAMMTSIDAAVRLSRWDEAFVALMAYLDASPIKREEGEPSERERLRREAIWEKIQRTAQGLEGLEKYDEALKLWRGLMTPESGLHPSIESELARLEEKRDLARLYREAKHAIFQNDHSLAAKLLKDIVLKDESYKDVLQLLTQVTAKRRATQKTVPFGWMRVAAPVALTAACISLAVIFWSSSWFQALIPATGKTATPDVERATYTAVVSPTADLRAINPANQHKYLFVQKELNWRQAKDYCAARGGYLATIQDRAEDDFVYQLTSGNTFLGASDTEEEGTWVWVSGEPWGFTNWDVGEPNNNEGDEDYLSYHYDVNTSHWNDQGNGPLFFTCEWQPDTEPVNGGASDSDQVRAFADSILKTIAGKTPDYQDDFSDPGSGWPRDRRSFGNESDYQSGGYLISNWRVKRTDGGSCTGVDIPSYPSFAGFVLEVDWKFLNQGTGTFTTIFRQDGASHYGVNISPAGIFQFHKNVEGEHVPLSETESSISSFVAGAEGLNHLTLVARGYQMAVYVNHEPVMILADFSSSQGLISFGVCDGDPLQVEIDNVKVWDVSDVSIDFSPVQIRAFAGPILSAVGKKAPDYQDDFENPKSGWPSGSITDGTRWGYLDGVYSLSVTRGYSNSNGDSCLDISPGAQWVSSDFVLEAEVQFVSNTPGSLHLFFRGSPPDPVYFMGMTSDGIFFLHKNIVTDQVHQADMVERSAVPPFASGRTKNRLTLIAQGSRMAVYADGQPFVLVTDESWQGGAGEFIFGVCSDLDAESPLLEAHFDNFKVWDVTTISP